MPARAILINADDLGLWPSVDHGIFEARSQHAVSDSTVFANAPWLPLITDAAGRAGLPVGVHLNLTYGHPLCDPEEIPALVTAEGTFMRREHWILPLPQEQVRHELSRQVQRVLGLGWRPSHLDSHHHVHLYPEVLDVVIALAREHALPVRSVNEQMRRMLRAAGIVTPDAFSMAFYGEAATCETLVRLVEECPGGVLEVMAHPGYADAALPSSYRDAREQELRVLTSPAWQEYLLAKGIPLISFSALHA